MKNSILYYGIGPLLYCPANNQSIADAIIREKFGTGYSLALCLEDTIGDCHVAQAEQILIQSLNHLAQAHETAAFFMPKLFIRVRSAAQITDLLQRLDNAHRIVSGFILPKLDLSNITDYIKAIQKANTTSSRTFYAMPILETPALADPKRRAGVLCELKDRLNVIEKYILNIRVGGNDLCHLFGFRRRCDESIHRIQPISNIFADIISVFGMDYIVSGPVWEYYNGNGWDTGLRQELAEDRLCGFIGKTAIHPKQIPLIRQAYAVTPEDLKDAQAILGWKKDAASFVSGNTKKERMNEYKTHTNWAEKIIYLSEAYGVL